MQAKLIQEAKMLSQEKLHLRKRLDQFYATVSDYLAFASPSDQVNAWSHIEGEISSLYAKINRPVNILEVGAGKSGFGDWLLKKSLRDKVKWTSQDITRLNEDFLTKHADYTIYGDVNAIPLSNKYDIIFSTYVLEHVTNPQEHLNFLYELLSEQGKIFIFCPRYDMPGYLCPSTRHLSVSKRIAFATKSLLLRSLSIFSGKPVFLIQTDLAAFYQPFFLDADAVHWVSQLDLKLWAKRKKAKFETLKFGNPDTGSKDWIVKRFLTCSVKIVK